MDADGQLRQHSAHRLVEIDGPPVTTADAAAARHAGEALNTEAAFVFCFFLFPFVFFGNDPTGEIHHPP